MLAHRSDATVLTLYSINHENEVQVFFYQNLCRKPQTEKREKAKYSTYY